MEQRFGIITVTVIMSLLFAGEVFAFEPDSIASKNRVFGFGVSAYRWVDRVFNGTDTAYISPTGYRWNVKLRANSWSDFNGFYFDRDHRMGMVSPSCISIGADVQYMAIALGYDINVNRLVGGKDRSKSRFNFEFSSALVSGRLYSIRNEDGMTIRSLGEDLDEPIRFSGVRTSTWGIDLIYYFNHRRYSNQAAFSFGKIQKKSQGAFLTGVFFQSQKLFFDFGALPEEVRDWLPENWRRRNYHANGWNLGIGGGYGFNWVPRPNLTVGILGIVIPSVNYGFLNSETRGCSFRMNYRMNASVVWNRDRWFVGGVARADAGFIYSGSTLTNGLISFDAKIGWRF